MLRIPHCLDNQLTDGGSVVSPTHRLHITPWKHYYFSASVTHFRKWLSEKQQPEGLGEFKKSPHRVSSPRASGL
jgi:hypothetical protein